MSVFKTVVTIYIKADATASERKAVASSIDKTLVGVLETLLDDEGPHKIIGAVAGHTQYVREGK